MSSIFDNPTDDTTPVLPDADYLETLVGEGKKFKDVQSLARGKAESDKYIEQLRSKLDETLKELQTRSTLEDMITKIKSPSASDPVPAVSTPAQSGQDDSDIERRLEELLIKREQKRASETNAQMIERVLSEQFGPQAQALVHNKARELGMTPDQLKNIATSNPNVFFKLVDVDPTVSKPSTAAPAAKNGLNSSAPTDGNGTVRNARYYEKMKRENPKLYFDGKTTQQQIKDHLALGDAYYS